MRRQEKARSLSLLENENLKKKRKKDDADTNPNRPTSALDRAMAKKRIVEKARRATPIEPINLPVWDVFLLADFLYYNGFDATQLLASHEIGRSQCPMIAGK